MGFDGQNIWMIISILLLDRRGICDIEVFKRLRDKQICRGQEFRIENVQEQRF